MGLGTVVGWPTVSKGVDLFAAVDDVWSRRAMRALADSGIVSGETGAAGLAGLLALMEEGDGAREPLGISPETRVLLFNCEGATDPEAYGRILAEAGDAAQGPRPWAVARRPGHRARGRSDLCEGNGGCEMRETNELPTFLGRTAPVEFAARLRGYEMGEDGAAVVLRTSDH